MTTGIFDIRSFSHADEAAEHADFLLRKTHAWTQDLQFSLSYFETPDDYQSINTSVNEFQHDLLPYLFDLDAQEGFWDWANDYWGFTFDGSSEAVDRAYINASGKSQNNFLRAGSGITVIFNNIFSNTGDLTLAFIKNNMFIENQEAIIQMLTPEKNYTIGDVILVPAILLTLGEDHDY